MNAELSPFQELVPVFPHPQSLTRPIAGRDMARVLEQLDKTLAAGERERRCMAIFTALTPPT
jgi:hypothetical protein